MQHADKDKTPTHEAVASKPVTRAELKAESKAEQAGNPAASPGTPVLDGAQAAVGMEKDLKTNDQAGLTAQNQLSQAIGDSQVTLYCICRTADETNMICCDKCEEWYHFQCVGI